MLDEQMRSALARRRTRATLRALTVHHTTARPAPTSAAAAAAPLADFSSNDYLSLASAPEMRTAFVQRVLAARTAPLGSTGSRLLDGNSIEHEQLEQRLAAFFRAPAALFFGSGFEANVSLFSTLPQPGDLILFDELIHASVHDGMRQSRCAKNERSGACVSFRHNDLADLERLLARYCLPSGTSAEPTRADFAHRLAQRRCNVFIAVEAVYSMDGDLCPLRALAALAARFVPRGCLHIVVDEAHSTGTYGPQGRGLCAALGLGLHPPSSPEEDPASVIRLATFGKACGASGAVVLASPLVREYLLNYARPFIFSTAPPQSVLMAAHAAIDMFERADVGCARRRSMARLTSELVVGLRGAVAYAAAKQAAAAASDLPLLALVPALAAPDPADDASPSPIVPVLTPYPRPLAAHLQARGFLVRPITYPTVPRGQDRVRICVHADNTPAQVAGLCAAVREWVDTVVGARDQHQAGIVGAEGRSRGWTAEPGTLSARPPPKL